MVVVVVCK